MRRTTRAATSRRTPGWRVWSYPRRCRRRGGRLRAAVACCPVLWQGSNSRRRRNAPVPYGFALLYATGVLASYSVCVRIRRVKRREKKLLRRSIEPVVTADEGNKAQEMHVIYSLPLTASIIFDLLSRVYDLRGSDPAARHTYMLISLTGQQNGLQLRGINGC